MFWPPCPDLTHNYSINLQTTFGSLIADHLQGHFFYQKVWLYTQSWCSKKQRSLMFTGLMECIDFQQSTLVAYAEVPVLSMEPSKWRKAIQSHLVIMLRQFLNHFNNLSNLVIWKILSEIFWYDMNSGKRLPNIHNATPGWWASLYFFTCIVNVFRPEYKYEKGIGEYIRSLVRVRPFQ